MKKFLLCFSKIVQLSSINSYLAVQNEKSKIVYPVFEKSKKKSDNFKILKKNLRKI